MPPPNGSFLWGAVAAFADAHEEVVTAVSALLFPEETRPVVRSWSQEQATKAPVEEIAAVMEHSRVGTTSGKLDQPADEQQQPPQLLHGSRPEPAEANRDGDADDDNQGGLQSQPTGNAGGEVIASTFFRRQAAPSQVSTSDTQNDMADRQLPPQIRRRHPRTNESTPAKPSPAVAAASSPPATPLDDPGATGGTGSSSMGSSMGSSTVSCTGSSSRATAAMPPPAGTAVRDAEEAHRLCFEAEKATWTPILALESRLEEATAERLPFGWEACTDEHGMQFFSSPGLGVSCWALPRLASTKPDTSAATGFETAVQR